MATRVTPRQLIIQNENSDLHTKKAALNGNIKSSKTAKKGGGALGSRKALNDITNKAPLKSDTSSKKKNIPKEEFNVFEEMFLHDHSKCIEEQKAKTDVFFRDFLDMVLPGHDSVSTAESLKVDQAKTDPYSPRCYPEPTEMSMSEFSDWFGSSTQWNSPPDSPIHLDSEPSSPFAWRFEEVEFVLKEENDG